MQYLECTLLILILCALAYFGALDAEHALQVARV